MDISRIDFNLKIPIPGRIANQTGEETDGGTGGGATKRNQMTSGNNSIGGTPGMAAITSSGGVGGNGTGMSGVVTGTGPVGSTGIVSGTGMTPIGGQMVVGPGGAPGGGVVMVDGDQMAAAGTNSSRPYDTPERRSSIRIRGQSVNDGRNVK